MTDLWEILKVSEGLPSPDLKTLLFARKLNGQASRGSSLETLTTSGYPCVLAGSAGMPAVDYKIYGSTYQSPEMYSPILCDKDGYQLVDAEGYTLCSNDTPQYVIKSVGELVIEGEFSGKYCIPVVTSGKNLFDYTNITDGYRIVWVTGILYKDPNAQLSGYIPVNSHKEYVTSSKVNIAGYDLNKNYLGVYNGYEFVKTTVTSLHDRFITADDCRFIRIFRYGTVKNFENDFQLELGDTATPYEPYHEPITTNIYLDEPLKTGDILKYPENIIEHADGATESISLPKLPTLNGTTIITTDTEIQPSNMEITYKGRKENV